MAFLYFAICPLRLVVSGPYELYDTLLNGLVLVCCKLSAHRLAENLVAIRIIDHGTDFLGSSIRFDNFILPFHPLLVPRPILLFDLLIILDCFYEFRFHQGCLRLLVRTG